MNIKISAKLPVVIVALAGNAAPDVLTAAKELALQSDKLNADVNKFITHIRQG